MRNRISGINKKIAEALRKIEKEENVSISFGTSRYSEVEYKVPMTIKSNSTESKKTLSSENTQKSKLLGFSKNIVGTSFRSNGKVFKVTDIKLNRPKYPIIASNSRGTLYKFTPDSVKREMV